MVWNTRHPDEPPRAVVQLLDVVPITSFTGLELFPDLSPNGAMLAFSWSGEGPTDIGALDLYVMQLPSGRPTRLVDGPGSVTYPSWSPDGTEIAFALQEATGSTVASVEVLSGEVRRLYSVSCSIEGLDWSPDGEWIVLATTEKETGYAGVAAAAPFRT
ncbi:MAG: PD40 domain-containing protein [Candidatus Eisenbacteria bacterium]|nr:PD40 domain-containing protein [Candidatus Eisenbacteria bacterium]